MRKEMTIADAHNLLYKKMCEKINVDPDTINPKEQFWFWKHTWTQKEENEFVDWLAAEIYKNNDFRRALTKLYYRPNKKLRIKAAQEFTNNFGWKIEG